MSQDTPVTQNQPRKRPMPLWAIAIILVLSSFEPLTHWWIATANFEGRVHTGLHTADSAVYLQSMRLFSTGFYSPYATCHATDGDHSAAYFPLVFHWIYGLVGLAADALSADHFLFLGLVNGLGLAAYLFAVFRFLNTAVPAYARTAFLVFTCSGGLGGVAYLLARVTGLADAPQFEEFFSRFAMYELVEGPYLFPWLHGARLYYTVSLALCFAALTTFLEAVRLRCGGHHLYAGIILFGATLINFRFGIMTFGLIVLYEIASGGKADVRRGWPMGVGVGLGVAISFLVMSMNPRFVSNTNDLVRETMWLTPFITTALLQLIAIPIALIPNLRVLPGAARLLALIGFAYLLVFAFMFFGYQFYFGNLLVARDAVAAIRISDWALAAALVACAPQLWRNRQRILHPDYQNMDEARTILAWVALWFIGYFAIAISAFGQGWLAQFAPQRFMVFLGVPMAILVAQALAMLRFRRSPIAKPYLILLLIAGLSSMIASGIYFQGPLGIKSSGDAFAHLHPEWMSAHDEVLLNEIPAATVAAPHRFADVIALRSGLSVLGGAGAADHSDQRSVDLQAEIERFFQTGQSDGTRSDFLQVWCVDYVYCPDFLPVVSAVLRELDQHPKLQRLHSAGNGALYRVTN